jgi:hypothetical protein
MFGLKLTEILSKQRGISVDANACFKKRYVCASSLTWLKNQG